MPAKNVLKEYTPQTYYHIYNRGVEKRTIFLYEKDYRVFLSYLRVYLLPQVLQGPSLKSYPSRQLKNFAREVDLNAYCLMPNHFHFLVYQHDSRSITLFMRALLTKYVKFFNTRYHRIGPLFQSRYKAVKIGSIDQLLYASKYIHRNPVGTSRSVLEVSQYSSYKNYLNIISQPWVKPQPVLEAYAHSNMTKSYETYVETVDDDEVIDDFNDDFKDGP